MRNEAISWLRRSGRHRAASIEDVNPAAHEPDPPNPQVERLAEAMARLPDGYREILLLKYEANLNYDQIAESLALSVGNVEKRLYRARQALLKLMPELPL